jgi:cell wall-associated NlpC family hydrolase
MVSEKKKLPYRIVYPDNQGKFKPEIPFGSKIDYKSRGALSTSKNLTLDSLYKILIGLVNIPYKWGGKTSLGFDCSGLVQSVIGCFGTLVPRDAKDQFQYFKKDKIEFVNAKLGDLYFFGSERSITHVGFSLGEKKILHSQGSVKIESLDRSKLDFNNELLDIYLSTHSIRRIFSS